MQPYDKIPKKPLRGFASIPKERQREIASKGGKATSSQFKVGEERTRAAGKAGGTVSGGNFAKSPHRAAEAGRKGGEASSRGKRKG